MFEARFFIMNDENNFLNEENIFVESTKNAKVFSSFSECTEFILDKSINGIAMEEVPRIWTVNQGILFSLCSNPNFYEKIYPFIIFPKNNEFEVGFKSFFLEIIHNEINLKKCYNVYESKPLNPKGEIIFFDEFYISKPVYFSDYINVNDNEKKFTLKGLSIQKNRTY